MKCIFFILFVSIFQLSFSQDLLVNGGFEDENICTEFHVNCAPEGWISTANTYNNFFKIPGIAHGGQHCMAIEAGNSRKRFIRSYIRTQLLCQLRKGNKYRIEFFAKSRHNILDSAGIYFSSYDFLFEKQILYQIIPAVYFADAIVRPQKNDTNWQKISIEYTATGRELYLTLGNFSKRDINGPTGIPSQNNFLIFFDDVSLTPVDPKEKICDNWKKTKDEIYSFDARHQFLEIYIKTYIKNPPVPPEVGKTIIQAIDTIILPDIFFRVDKSELSRKSFRLLDSLCTSLQNKQIDSLVVEGHTDNTGTTAHNEKLSRERATSVADYLSGKLSLNNQPVITRAWGSKKPVADNRTSSGRQLNRRVELFIYIRQ
jgi:outer membrane protein OmpA-like peptidoglycan-associated protein